MLQWHVGNSTSADLVLRDVQDAIVSEVTSFPVDKVALGESPSVAMHVPVPTLRQNPNGGPCNSQELGAAAMRMDEKRSSGGASGASGSGPSSDDDSCHYASGEALVAVAPSGRVVGCVGAIGVEARLLLLGAPARRRPVADRRQ